MKKFLNYRPQSAGDNRKNEKGFTLLETIASMAIFVVVVLLIGSIFILAQQIYRRGSATNELTQNIRVCFDRISRELRQAAFLISDTSATTTEIFFQNGHDSSQVSYIKYHLIGDELYRSQIVYYFPPLPADPNQYVRYNSIDEFGVAAASTTISSQIVGEYFKSLNFFGTNGLVTISAELEKSNTILGFSTKAYIRNW